MISAIREFLKMEAAGGIVLAAAAAVAVIVANSGLAEYYQAFLDLHFTVGIGELLIDKPLLLWVNDGLMAVFFFLVGMEVKREFLDGELSSFSQAVLPGIAAIGGMAAPALIYVAINVAHPENLNGWAIPAATDIAFALGVMALLGNRVPLSLKVLLTAIAIFDDLGAIIIIAVFYTAQLSFSALAVAGVGIVALAALNLLRVTRIAPYVLIGIVVWVCVLKSGVHATLAGVAVAMAIPLRRKDAHGRSPLRHLEHELHPWVSFGVLPIFGFANAGVSFAGIGLHSFVEPVKLGISLGLFLGKPIGVFGFVYACTRLGLLRLPEGVSWPQIFGVAMLCGIGFAMSLFIGSLAFEHTDFEAPVRLGVITGSIASGVLGYLILRFGSAKPREPHDQALS